MKNIRLLLLMPFLTLAARAQTFGGFPPSTRWKQINTDTARIIFTPGAEEQASRVATLIHRSAGDTALSFGNRLRKINVVLQSRTTAANGYVALAPFRSEFFLVPTSNVFEFGNLPWQDNLAIHEYRHVEQYNYFKRGLAKGFHFLFGEQGQALANALTVPDWFFEGDAVFAETAMTPQGRGRLPYFLSGYQSLWLEGRNYNWQKLRNGSLKDYVPNHYQLGYLLVNYGYLKYGSQFWEKVTADAAAFKGLVYPFQQAIARHAGIPFKQFRRDALNFYKQKLEVKGDSAVKRKRVTDYYFPQSIGQDSVLYLKTAYNQLPAFYISDSRGEHKIALQGISNEQWFGYRNGKVVYTAYSTHPRWSLVDYSDIVSLDVRNGNKKRITHEGRYYTPDLSPSGDRIIAVRITDSLQTELQVLEAATGKVLQTQRAAADLYYLNPRWVDESSVVVGVRTLDARVSLQLLDLKSGAATVLLPAAYHTMATPFVSGGRVYFTSNASGNDDLYAVQLKDKKIFQLTNGKTGHYFPSANGGQLMWSRFTSNGLRLEKGSADPLLWTEINAMTWSEQRELFPVAMQQYRALKERRFSEKRYSQSTGLLRFHSWAPNYVDPEFTFSLYSDNILNTFTNELFYRYNQNEKTNAVGWNSMFGGLFTVLNAGVDYTFNRQVSLTSNVASFDEWEARGGLSVPLNFTRGNTYKFLTLGSNLVYNRVVPKGPFKDSLVGSGQTYLMHYASLSHYLPRAVQHIFPKLGWAAGVQYRHSLSTARKQLLANTSVYLPSIANHSIVVNGAYQDTKQDENGFVFSNRFALSRGYQDYYLLRMWKLGGNYHFPLIYPDFGIASIAYLRRVRGNAFYDYSRVYNRERTRSVNLRSVGGEIYFDTKWWNQLPVSFGFRVSHLLDQGLDAADRKGSNYFEFILPVNLIR